MALDGTYTGLQASVADFLNRSDINSAIPDFIALAEAQMSRRLQTQQTWTIRTLTISGENLPLPSDIVAIESLQVQDNCVRKLEYVTPQMMDTRPIGSTGVPREYTVAGGCLVFWPSPQAAMAVRMRARAQICGLSLYNPTNWILCNHPDAYLYGALVQSAPYLKDDDRIQVWGQMFTAAIEAIEEQDRRLISDTLQMRSGISDGHRHSEWRQFNSVEPLTLGSDTLG